MAATRPGGWEGLGRGIGECGLCFTISPGTLFLIYVAVLRLEHFEVFPGPNTPTPPSPRWHLLQWD